MIFTQLIIFIFLKTVSTLFNNRGNRAAKLEHLVWHGAAAHKDRYSGDGQPDELTIDII